MTDPHADSQPHAARDPDRAETAHRPSRRPLPAVFSPLGPPLSAIYARVMARRNQRFDRRLGVIELDRPVISVGNLSVGGTGKTPMTRHVVSVLLAAGHKPCVAMRGYRGHGGVGGAGSDEAQEYRRAFPDLPIVARPDRVEGLIELFGSDDGDDIGTVVLDDGFQHRRLWRDLDIVLADATASPFEDRLLPAGWLREPVGSLRRAHAVVVTHAEGVDARALRNLEDAVQRASDRPVTAVCRHAWRSLTVHDATGARVEPVSWLSGRCVGAACAIGNPGSFLAQVHRSTGRVVGEVVLPDHDPFGRPALARVAGLVGVRGAEAIVVTSKDWSKLSRVPSLLGLAPIVVPELGFVFDRGQESLERMVLEVAGVEKVRAEDDEAFDEPSGG